MLTSSIEHVGREYSRPDAGNVVRIPSQDGGLGSQPTGRAFRHNDIGQWTDSRIVAAV